MAQAFTSLILTDGTTSIDLLDNENYSLVEGGYAPRVPRRRQEQLGGRGPYEDVEESCTINVYGTTAAEALAALDALVRLLEQAQAFTAGAAVNRITGAASSAVGPVTIQLRVQGSTLGAPLTSLIVGIPEGSPPVELPATYLDALMIWEIAEVTVYWKRRGPWLIDTFDVDNLVLNSSFEEWPLAVPNRWTALASPTVTQDTTYLKHGTKAARIENASTANTRGLYQDVTGLTTSSTYTVSAWVYVVAGETRLVAYDGGGVSNAVTVSSSGTGWQRLSLQKVAPASGIRITVAAYSAGAIGVFDAAMVELGSSATDYHLADVDYLQNVQSGAPVTGASSRHTVTFEGGNLDVLSPLDISLGVIGPTATSAITVPGGYLLVAADDAHIVKLEAEDMTYDGASITTQTVSGASGGETARAANDGGLLQNMTAAQVDQGRQLAIFAMVRKNTASDVWHLQARTYREGSNNLNLSKGGKVYLDDNAAEVIAVSLGVVSRHDPNFTLDINVNRVSGTGYLDIDTIIVLVVDNEASRGIALLEVNATEADSTSSSHSFGIRSRALTALTPQPFVTFTSLGDLTYPGYRGDAFLSTKGDTVVVMWLGTDGNQWFHIDQADGTPAELLLTARRYPAFLVPQ